MNTANVVSTEFGYNEKGNVSMLKNTLNALSQVYGYGYDKNGNITTETITTTSKGDIYNVMKASLEYGITRDEASLNIYNIKSNIKQLQDEAEDYMMKAACTEGDKSRYLDEVEKIFAKVKVLREQLEVLDVSINSTEANVYEKNRISELLRNHGVDIIEYDDMLVRRLIECIKIMANKTIVVIFKGGFEVTESLEE